MTEICRLPTQVGGPEDDWDSYCTGEDYEDDRDIDAEYESWRDMQDEEKYNK